MDQLELERTVNILQRCQSDLFRIEINELEYYDKIYLKSAFEDIEKVYSSLRKKIIENKWEND